MSDEKGRFRILDERVIQREAAPGTRSEATNPYWLTEDPAPHPDPARGCIRRGICCRSSPGWFAPGEVEQAAEVLGITPHELVGQSLVIDSIDVDGERVEVFAPVKLDRFGKPALRPGARVDDLYRFLRGVCTFFDGNGCGIYEARPYECRQYVCTNAPEENADHESIARMWLSGPPEE